MTRNWILRGRGIRGVALTGNHSGFAAGKKNVASGVVRGVIA